MSKCPVSIFVTVYNIEKYLDRFFECLKQQTFTDYQVLIIDDGSTDGSAEICRRYAAADSRIHVRSVEHIGISAARNLVFDMIDTEFAASLDGDDYFDKDYLRHLVDAQRKYDADLVVGGVVYRDEDGNETGRFRPEDEALYTSDSFPALIPRLFNEDKLNYLYSKLYRTEYLRDIRVEPDVKQGSDTMINMQYILRVNSIAVTGDYDYNYVRYTKRSVTSYAGADTFFRLCRINGYVYDLMQKNGRLNDDMTVAIDRRIVMICGGTAVYNIAMSRMPLSEKYRAASDVVNSGEYMTSYNRLKQLGAYERLKGSIIDPGQERAFVDRTIRDARSKKSEEKRAALLKKCPGFIFKAWHFVRVRTGTARSE